MRRDQSMRENVKIITDKDGRKLVVISKILFKGKRSICWDEVKKYLRQYVGNSYLIEDTNDTVYIGRDLPDEYNGIEIYFFFERSQCESEGECHTRNSRDA